MPGTYVTDLRRHLGNACIHLPGVRGIILNSKGEILLQLRADMDYWSLPAGTVELAETAFEALYREVMEETGLTVIEAEPMALHSGPSQRFQYPNGDCIQAFAITYIVRKWTGEPVPDGIEGMDLRFWPVNSLPANMIPVHRQTLDEYNQYTGRFIVSNHSTGGEDQQ